MLWWYRDVIIYVKQVLLEMSQMFEKLMPRVLSNWYGHVTTSIREKDSAQWYIGDISTIDATCLELVQVLYVTIPFTS